MTNGGVDHDILMKGPRTLKYPPAARRVATIRVAPATRPHARSGRIDGRLQHIADPAHATDQRPFLVAEFLAQAANAYVYDIGVQQIILAPDLIENQLAREDPPGMRQEQL